MKSLLATTVVWGIYQDYIPVYAASIVLAYPSYGVKVFLGGTLSDENRSTLRLMPAVEVVEGIKLQTEGQARKSERWLLPASAFEGFQYGWIGDVDVLVVREETPLHETEAARMQAEGLPHANGFRANVPDRVTGCHTVDVSGYFAAMGDQPVAEDLMLHNETVLYRMLQNACIAPRADDLRRRADCHGVHLGMMRNTSPLRVDPLWRTEPLRSQICTALTNPVFCEVKARCAGHIIELLDLLEDHIA